jgi:hypothetical protein
VEVPAILFFVFDSTPSVFANLRFWQKTAGGRLEHGELDALFDAARHISENGVVNSIDGGTLNVRYSNCVRAAVLHHHPLDERSNIDGKQ